MAQGRLQLSHQALSGEVFGWVPAAAADHQGNRVRLGPVAQGQGQFVGRAAVVARGWQVQAQGLGDDSAFQQQQDEGILGVEAEQVRQ
nr:hypothetical protein [Saccharothrix obliqua]